jgi:hypothetical protein
MLCDINNIYTPIMMVATRVCYRWRRPLLDAAFCHHCHLLLLTYCYYDQRCMPRFVSTVYMLLTIYIPRSNIHADLIPINNIYTLLMSTRPLSVVNEALGAPAATIASGGYCYRPSRCRPGSRAACPNGSVSSSATQHTNSNG